MTRARTMYIFRFFSFRCQMRSLTIFINTVQYLLFFVLTFPATNYKFSFYRYINNSNYKWIVPTIFCYLTIQLFGDVSLLLRELIIYNSNDEMKSYLHSIILYKPFRVTLNFNRTNLIILEILPFRFEIKFELKVIFLTNGFPSKTF